MNNVEKFLEDYKQTTKLNNDEMCDDNWEKFWNTNQLLTTSTGNFFKQNINFLPENQVLDFHDSYFVGNVKPIADSNNFKITIRALCYEKVEKESAKTSYQEIEPKNIDITIDNKFRGDFHKLAVKAATIMSLVYDNNNLGIVYLSKDSKLKTAYLENIDLSQIQSVEKKMSKKMK